MTFIMITRFNNTTWEELTEYKRRNHTDGAFYGVPVRIAPTIPLKSRLYVLEMNNDTNTIMGVGLIRNFIKMDQVHPIYTWGNYHRFTYAGKYRIPRDEMTDEENELIEKMEARVFKGKGHLKRGQGIQKVPYERYNKQELELFKQMFRDRLP
ncbi:MAG: hypothetical protein ACR2M6_02945 [Vampirovibrionia bacterium]|jgi:hypothetical protein